MKRFSPLFITTLLLALLPIISSCCKKAVKPGSASSASSNSTSQSDISGVRSESLSDVFGDNSVNSPVIRKKIVYTAFGDSIARGFGLEAPEKVSYPSLIAETLSQNAEQVVFTNLAKDGQTSEGTLSEIKSAVKAVKNSDLITVSTGANNILGAFYDDVLKIFAENGMEIENFDELVNVVADSLVSQNPEKLNKLSLIFLKLNSYFEGDEFSKKIEDAAQRLKHDLTQIKEIIASINNDAVVVFQTIYNPYKNFKLTIGDFTFFDFEGAAEKAVKALNNVILTFSSDDIFIADVFTAFENYSGKNTLVNAGLSIFDFSPVSADPHPTKTGHELIASTVLSLIN